MMGLTNLVIISLVRCGKECSIRGRRASCRREPWPHRLGGQASQQIQAAHHDELYQHAPDQDVGEEIILGLERHDHESN